MKTCLKCMTTTLNDNIEKCNVCGSTNFRSGRPKTGYKMEETVEGKADSSKGNNTTKQNNVDKAYMAGSNNKSKAANQISNTGIGNYDVDDYADDDVSIGSWVVTFIIMTIPVINIIFAIIKIAKSGSSKTVKNYFKASIIVNVAAIIISAVAGTVLTSMIVNFMYTLY